MEIELMVDAATDTFKKNLQRLCRDMDAATLTPAAAQAVTQALQEAAASGCLTGLRVFLESSDTQADVVCDKHGVSYRFKKTRNRAFITACGKVTVSRRCYQNASDTKSFAPLDAAWGMEKHYLTPEVREAVSFACAHMTPAEVALMLKKCALFQPDITTIKREAARTGAFIEANRDALDAAVHAQETLPEGVRALVVSADGATVLTRDKGVHFGRPAERPGGEKSEETPTAYRIAMVGCLSYYGDSQAPAKTPERLLSRYVAHMPEARCPTFKAMLEAELDGAEARLPAGVPRILLLDAARELWNYFDKNPRYDGYHRCIDFWHAVEHLSVAAEALFGAGDQAQKWYEKHCRILRENDDGAARIVRSINYYEKTRTRSRTSEKHLNEQRTYFRRNGARMPYATFRASGWPIGSGPMEAACKTIVKTRMCRSGMRWTRSGGQNILDLRTYAKSGRWDAAWREIRNLENAA